MPVACKNKKTVSVKVKKYLLHTKRFIILISGKGGQKIREIQEKSGANIKVDDACWHCASHIFPTNCNLVLLF